MADHTLPPAGTVIVGMTGSGKSELAYRYLSKSQVACRFIFDDLGRAATRLGITPARTEAQCIAALASRWVLFNPHTMFAGDTRNAFRWFCQWCYNVSKGGPGKKLLLIDEVWQWQNNQQIPRELALCTQTGREENLETVLATQLPHKINASITGQSTEIIIFRTDEDLATARAVELAKGLTTKEEVENLPLGSFVAVNRISRGVLRGLVF